MISISKADIMAALRAVGVARGQVIYLQTDLSIPGRLTGIRTREAFSRTYFDALFEIIGDEGTLVVPTYTTQVARYDLDFVLEKTTTTMGTFPEFVRRLPESLRSLHPVHSFSAVGRHRETICANNGASDFGWGSPLHRMLDLDTRIVTIGLESGYVVGNVHLMEVLYGVPYVYNKLLKWRPVVNGQKVDRDFFCSARNLNLDARRELTLLAERVHARHGIASSPLGGAMVYMADYRHVFDEGMRLLHENPYGFLAGRPEFTYGVQPFDGPTGGRDGISEEAHLDDIANWVGVYISDKADAGGHGPATASQSKPEEP